jgi:hypothetical protein
MSIASAAELVEALREHLILEPAQLENITAALGRSPEPRTVASELH